MTGVTYTKDLFRAAAKEAGELPIDEYIARTADAVRKRLADANKSVDDWWEENTSEVLARAQKNLAQLHLAIIRGESIRPHFEDVIALTMIAAAIYHNDTMGDPAGEDEDTAEGTVA